MLWEETWTPWWNPYSHRIEWATQKGPRRPEGLNPDPACCEAAALTAAPQHHRAAWCHHILWKKAAVLFRHAEAFCCSKPAQASSETRKVTISRQGKCYLPFSWVHTSSQTTTTGHSPAVTRQSYAVPSTLSHNVLAVHHSGAALHLFLLLFSQIIPKSGQFSITAESLCVFKRRLKTFPFPETGSNQGQTLRYCTSVEFSSIYTSLYLLFLPNFNFYYRHV